MVTTHIAKLSANINPCKVHMRYARGSDIATLIDIEKIAFGAGNWDVDEFHDFLNSAKATCVVATCELTDEILGYMCFREHKRTYQIHNLAVRNRYTRAGVGRQLLLTLMRKITTGGGGGKNAVLVKIPPGLHGRAVKFFIGMGFKEVGCRKPDSLAVLKYQLLDYRAMAQKQEQSLCCVS